MGIVASVIAAQSPQADGRVWIEEVHTDQLALTYPIFYLAPSAAWVAANAAAHLATDAADLTAGLTANEVAANLNSILTLGAGAVFTTNYSSFAQLEAAILASIAGSGGALQVGQQVQIGRYMNAVPASQLAAFFGITLTQAQSIQAAVTTMNAGIAAVAAFLGTL